MADRNSKQGIYSGVFSEDRPLIRPCWGRKMIARFGEQRPIVMFGTGFYDRLRRG